MPGTRPCLRSLKAVREALPVRGVILRETIFDMLLSWSRLPSRGCFPATLGGPGKRRRPSVNGPPEAVQGVIMRAKRAGDKGAEPFRAAFLWPLLAAFAPGFDENRT